MKKLTTTKDVFGPYEHIEIQTDRYRCDGADLPVTVVGMGEVTEWDGPLPVPPGPPLDDLKAEKRAEINANRLAANFSTFMHAGKVIACDQLSRSDIDGTNGFVTLYGAMPPGWPGGWKAVDNTYTPIATVADWKAFYASMFAAGAANFAKAQQLKAALDVAATADEIAAIAW